MSFPFSHNAGLELLLLETRQAQELFISQSFLMGHCMCWGALMV